ncbi:MAG: hypothetical protein K2G04_07880 [Oscillospiraceae bacterium]|nr:hypothetical protein [Oscillospiraceae bacterium]
MNKKELKKLYSAHCENTAPDMEKLWEKIESGLEEKPESRVTSKPAKVSVSVKQPFGVLLVPRFLLPYLQF